MLIEVTSLFHNLVPDLFVHDISAIDLNTLKENGITAVILDLDNTLDSHETKTPSARALSFLEELKAGGFLVCVISNGKRRRVEAYLAGFEIPFVADAGKPLKKSYRKALNTLGCRQENTAFVGDQIFTDTWGANRMGLFTILVEPIEAFETPLFYIKRALERFVKAKLLKE